MVYLYDIQSITITRGSLKWMPFTTFHLCDEYLFFFLFCLTSALFAVVFVRIRELVVLNGVRRVGGFFFLFSFGLMSALGVGIRI